MPEIRVEPVQVAPNSRTPGGVTTLMWVWRCDCHDRESAPWPEPPKLDAAVAEHDFAVAERVPGPRNEPLR